MDPEEHHQHFRIPVLLIGLFIGVILTLSGFFIKNNFLDAKKTNSTSPKTLTLSIDSPGPNFATASKNITISGSTAIKSVVTVNVGSQTQTIETQGEKFSTNLELAEGKNIVTITAYDPNTGESRSKIRNILYINEDLSTL